MPLGIGAAILTNGRIATYPAVRTGTAMPNDIEHQLAIFKRGADELLVEAEVAAKLKRAKETKQPVPEQGIRLVAAGIRDLQGQEHALERARLQLQQLDQRRAY